MSKRDLDARERRVRDLAASEQNICERLLSLRAELDGLTRGLDRVVGPGRPRLRAGTGLDLLGNLVRFKPRGKL